MFSLTEEEKHTLLKIARHTLEEEFKRNSDFFPQITDTLKGERPCFVTLSIRGRLRGCIGCLETTTPLHENVGLFAKKAAFEDPRFPELKENELEEISVGVSVLGPLEPLPSLESIEIGRHGLCVQSGVNGGVLLAKVASENNWDREEFLYYTCEKAGLNPEESDNFQKSYFEEISFEE